MRLHPNLIGWSLVAARALREGLIGGSPSFNHVTP